MTPGQAKRKHLTHLLGTFYNGTAPDATPSPYVVAVELGAEDVRNGMASAGAVEFEPRVYAEAIGEAFPSALAQTIQDALEQATTQQGEWQVFSYRIRSYEDSFVSQDGTARQFRREGGDFRVLVRPIPAQVSNL